MRSLSATLLAAQTASRIPYFDLKFYRDPDDSETLLGDYSCSGETTDDDAKLMYLKIHELAYSSGIGSYSDVSNITLIDNDRSIPDLTGGCVDIGIGAVTASGNEFAEYPRMWVKRQRTISAPGKSLVNLQLIGWAEFLAAEHARYDDSITDPTLYHLWNRTDTPYDILTRILHADYSYIKFILDALDVDDGIIDTFLPYFELNAEQNRYESKLDIITALLYMTKCYLKPLADNHLKLVYPQASDATNLTIYSDALPWFYEFDYDSKILIPNSELIFCDNSEENILTGAWPNLKIGQAVHSDSYTKLNSTNIFNIDQATKIIDADEANDRAEAVVARWDAEQFSQAFVIPHHCGIELYDYVLIKDKRGRLAYKDTKTRITGLTHTFVRGGKFTLTGYGGGLVNFPLYTDYQIENMEELELSNE